MRKIGDQGEELAAEYLQKQNYQIIEKNFRSKSGEIDIIAEDNGVLVFVEVKYYQKDSWKNIHDAVDYGKQRKIIKTAEYYLAKNKIVDKYTRFDMVLISYEDNKPVSSIELHKDAFRYN